VAWRLISSALDKSPGGVKLRVIKSREMRWAGYVPQGGNKKYVQNLV
jgi:hypothetical protein